MGSQTDGRLAQARCQSAANCSAVATPVPQPPRGASPAPILSESVDRQLRALDATLPTNNASGLDCGVTNGEDLRITGYMKPIATLMKPLRSIDLTTLEESPAAIERSDVCAVPAAAVVAEAMVAFVLADAAIEKFGGDSMTELVANWQAFRTAHPPGSIHDNARPRHLTQNPQNSQSARNTTSERDPHVCTMKIKESNAMRFTLYVRWMRENTSTD
jgi:hypothetical protein